MKAVHLCALFCACLWACAAGPKGEERNNSKTPEKVEVIDYHENGVVKMRGLSVAGKRQGKWESFYPSGYKWSETTFDEGRKEGMTTTFYPNGMMRYAGQYYNDERSGLWIFYDTLGKVIQRIDMDTTLTNTDSLVQTLGPH